MNNRIYSFVIGMVITLSVSAVAHLYLHHQKNKIQSQLDGTFWESLEGLDLRFTDSKYKSRSHRETSSPVVLIAVDDASIKEVGRWPWGRDLMAQLNKQLMKYQVAAVGMDVIWSEPEKGLPENDIKLGEVVEKHSDRIVLGTFSNNEIKIAAYQDYCVNEAFLFNGGEDLVKINPTFIIDDEGETFDSIKWNQFFIPLFHLINRETESQYLKTIHKKSLDELTPFQKNYLRAQKSEDIFKYCKNWLTDDDHLMSRDPQQIKKMLHSVLAEHPRLAAMNIDQQIKEIKSSVSEFPVPQYGDWQSNIVNIQKPSLYTASFVAHLDSDGFVRRYPLFYRSGNRLGTSFIPSLALQTYLVAQGYRAEVTVSKKNNAKEITSFKIIDPSTDPETVVQELPVDPQGRLIVNYYGPQNTLPYVSAKDLLSDDEWMSVMTFKKKSDLGIEIESRKVKKQEYLKGKSAILGVTSIAVYDLRNTPIEKNFPGPEIHLTMLANLMEGQYLKKLNREDIILPVIMVILGMALSWTLSSVGASQAMICLLIVLLIGFLIDKWLFLHKQIVASSFFVLFEVIFLHFGMLFYKYFSEEKKRGELKKTFSKYVSPAVVDELLKNEENLKLGGRKEEMSVFFSDVRGFTQFSEKMDPQDLSQFLNEYLTPMTEIIFKNKGTLDKYMGDGVMAFFGAPVPYADHAVSACQCALESLEALKKIQVEFNKRNWPQIDIGIGINTGFMSVGNMGSKIVQSYTVIGDAVNLGSRLEGATKEYGARILVSESTYAAAREHFLFREVDLVRVKGKKEPIRAYQLLDAKDGSTDREWLKLYEEAYSQYHARQFDKAMETFSQIETSYPEDLLSKIYKERCREFIAMPPPLNWDGVFEMRTK